MAFEKADARALCLSAGIMGRLKRSIKSNCVRIESLAEMFSLLAR